MKVLVVGSGGREHTIVWKLRKEEKVDKIYCAPGNAGISKLADIVDIKDNDIEGLLNFAKKENIDLTIVGPEVPLVLGIVDEFEKKGLKIFGPNKECSQLEGSKVFSKNFMIRHNIPTAKYKEYTDINEAKKNIGMYGYPVVIKADGLAAGKGVIIAQNENEAVSALEEIMENKKFGDSGNKVVVEEFLEGIETSILAFVDGETIVPMVSAKDHKKVFDNEKGPNTGGMGTFSPSNIYDEKLEKEIREKVLKPILEGLKKDKLEYKGVLFIGLMITNDGAKVLEFNVRFGDPETQVVLTRLETDLVDIIDSILNKRLSDIDIKWSEGKTVCVILTSGGYPDNYEKGKVIKIGDLDEDILLFHSGTRLEGNNILTNGGRVIGVTAKGKTLEEATKKVYENIDKIYFDKVHYRKDIGIR
ncbi:phosphoribosylamine--glycine ligase [Tepidibacter formicigenes]|jgi:phosphoribosylamine--glycine ligase|uniref:Phosphoribosylamine--glycine ligase n=1 Tax=Tepidibacter formicigenes DSM 15518 TaxID=1123349 RepID=A0A1M6NE15_9FIRM|nr:phosphoribosylamine--glycine ligase [Tepidibacter formicigenes]SHJ93945.1 phosphoribosylamine--glycine ligase [Tepidibacter formicigenes DSM 15518]